MENSVSHRFYSTPSAKLCAPIPTFSIKPLTQYSRIRLTDAVLDLLFFYRPMAPTQSSPSPSPTISNKDNGRRGFSKQHTIHAHTPGPSSMTLTVSVLPPSFSHSRRLRTTQQKMTKGRTHAKRRPTVGPF